MLAGSRASTESFAVNIYANLRKQLINDGCLVETADPNFLEFAEDVTFSSPSAAAAVIKNRNTNGRILWKIAGTNQSLKEWQDAQLAEISSTEE